MSDPRQVAPGLWVGSIEARRAGHTYDLIIDCINAGEPHEGRIEVVTPSGRGTHQWLTEDFDKIVALVAPVLEANGKVLIHCRRGVSRSVTAAAAVVLSLGLAPTVDEAIEITRHPDHRPATSSLGSLRRWWGARARAERPESPVQGDLFRRR